VWNCIEASRISNEKTKPSPKQITAEVWMALIHGSTGLIYFVHQFAPKFVEASLLEDPEMLGAVTEVNARIRELAPVLNSPTVGSGGEVASSPADVPVAMMVKRHGGATYVFSVAMRDREVEGAFSLRGMKGKAMPRPWARKEDWKSPTAGSPTLSMATASTYIAFRGRATD
jgi:hypothetical protein